MIASLPMYDWPEAAPSTDALWGAIRDAARAEGLAPPEALNRDLGLWQTWQSPALFLSQTCGMPYRSRLHGQVSLIATPDYGLPGAPAGYYYSQLVVRRDETGSLHDLVERTLAYNGQDSQSGWAAPQNHAVRLGLRFRRSLHTASHDESARAVAEGRADIAAIDAVSFRLLTRFLPETAAALRVLEPTEPTPGLPLIAAAGTDPAPLRRALARAFADLPGDAAAPTGLCGLALVPAAAYLAVPTPPPPSQDAAGNPPQN